MSVLSVFILECVINFSAVSELNVLIPIMFSKFLASSRCNAFKLVNPVTFKVVRFVLFKGVREVLRASEANFIGDVSDTDAILANQALS